MSSFGAYLLGVLILVLGLGIAAYLLNVPPLWIAAGVVVMLALGLGVARAASRPTSRPAPSDPPPGPLR